MAENKPIIGWLAPNGIFYECDRFNHMDKAMEIVKKYFGENFKSESRCIEDDFLMSHGFLKFGVDGFGSSHVYGNYNDKFVKPTDLQVEYAKNNCNNAFQYQKFEDLIKLSNFKNCICGDCNIKEINAEDMANHTMDEYPEPTEYILIENMVPVEAYCRPKIGAVYPVIKSGNEYYGKHEIKFILVNGEEVGVYVGPEGRLVENPIKVKVVEDENA